MKFIFIFFLFFTFLNAQFNIEITDLTEYKMNDKNIFYKITAEKKILNNQNLNKALFFINKEDVVSNNFYYTNGSFESKDMKIEFKKAYFLEGNFIMIDNSGFYKENIFQSKKAIFKITHLELQNVIINIENKMYKKLKYIITF